MDNKNQRPMVGIGVMILRDGRVLLGKRKGSHGAGEWSFPGGHLEYKEGFEDCVKREVAEECGIEIKNIRFQLVARVKEYLPKDYVHLNFLADWESGEPIVLEKDKCDGWQWFPIDQLPKPIMFAAKFSFENIKSGKNYFDNNENMAQ